MAELRDSPSRSEGGTFNSPSTTATIITEDTESTFTRTPSASFSHTYSSNVFDSSLDPISPVSSVAPSASSTLQSQAPLVKPAYPHLKTTRLFFAALCALFLFQFAFVSGYTPSILSALEVRYGLSSTQVAVVLSAYDIGGFVSAIPISYIGGSTLAHRPRWIGVSGLLMALASLIWAIPDFYGGLYSPDDSMLGMAVNGSNSTIATSLYCSVDLKNNSTCPYNATSKMDEKNSGIALGVFIIGHAVSGLSAMTPLALGPPYMQDGLPGSSFALYLGLLYSTTAIGPVLGFGLGAACQSIYVDFVHYMSGSDQKPNLTPSSPAWVGAWWLGYVILSFALVLSSIPFFFFPRSVASRRTYSPNAISDASCMSSPAGKEDEEADSDMVLPSLDEAPRELLRDAWSLLKNPVWILNNAIFVAVSSPVNGFVAYLKKYMESMFGYSAPTASLLMGGILVPAAAFGVAGGGMVNRKFGADFTHISLRHIIYGCVAGAALVVMMLVRCPNNAVVGVHVPYFSKPNKDAGPFSRIRTETGKKLEAVGLSSECNANCGCSPSQYDPICGSDGFTYFSGCYAGCSVPPQLSDKEEFLQCKCIANWNETIREKFISTSSEKSGGLLKALLMLASYGTATTGACTACILSSAVFLAVTFVATLSMSFGHNGTMLMLLRSIPRNKRALSLGLHSVLFKLLSAVPAPLMFGRAVDSACIYSSSASCGGHASSGGLLGSYCLLYDADVLATAVFGLAFGYCGAAVGFLVLLFAYLMRSRWAEVAKKYLAGPRRFVNRITSSMRRRKEKSAKCSRATSADDIGSNGDPLAEAAATCPPNFH